MSVLSGLFLFRINQPKRPFLILNIVTVDKLTITIFNFQIIYTVDAKTLLETIVSMFLYKFQLWFKKGNVPRPELVGWIQ